MGDIQNNTLYEGLSALAASAFPKRCRTCGRIYHSVDEFIAETRLLKSDHSGLQSSEKEDGTLIVELFRNCPCGSTLMDVFNSRRDISENGIKRRNDFDKLMATVEKQYNVDSETARNELLKIIGGESSDIIKNIMPSHPRSDP